MSGFDKSGYPQHLRIVLGIAKPTAAIGLLLPRLALLKELAYAGAAFAWVMASEPEQLSAPAGPRQGARLRLVRHACGPGGPRPVPATLARSAAWQTVGATLQRQLAGPPELLRLQPTPRSELRP